MIALSGIAANAMLSVLSVNIDGGQIEILDAKDNVLAVLQLASPAAKLATNGELVFNDIAEESSARATGTAWTANILNAVGQVVFICDVGDEQSDAVIKLNSTRIARGMAVRIRSFKLAFPIGGN